MPSSSLCNSLHDWAWASEGEVQAQRAAEIQAEWYSCEAHWLGMTEANMRELHDPTDYWKAGA